MSILLIATWSFSKLYVFFFKPGKISIIWVIKTNDKTNLVNQTEFDPEDQEVVSQIQQLLDTKIKPAVAQDGGDVEFNRFHNGVVYLTLQGSCVGCPSSTMTLKSGIENLLKHYVREVKSVEQQV